MEIKVVRFQADEESTLGFIKVDGDTYGFTLEDEERDVKIKGETRIPEGIYKLGIRDFITPMTKKYRSKYSWFDKHIEILNVPNFDYVYIHVGNYESNTEGCILVGDGAEIRQNKSEIITKSAICFERLYKKLYPVLESGETVKLIIEDYND